MNQKLAFLEIMALCLTFKNFNPNLYYCFPEQKYGNRNDYELSKDPTQLPNFYFDKRKEIIKFRPNLKRK